MKKLILSLIFILPIYASNKPNDRYATQMTSNKNGHVITTIDTVKNESLRLQCLFKNDNSDVENLPTLSEDKNAIFKVLAVHQRQISIWFFKKMQEEIDNGNKPNLVERFSKFNATITGSTVCHFFANADIDSKKNEEIDNKK